MRVNSTDSRTADQQYKPGSRFRPAVQPSSFQSQANISPFFIQPVVENLSKVYDHVVTMVMEHGHTACDVYNAVLCSVPLGRFLDSVWYQGRSLHHRVGCPLTIDPYLECWEVVGFLLRANQHYCGISRWDESLKPEPHQKEDNFALHGASHMSVGACFVLSDMDSVGLYTFPVMLDHTATFFHQKYGSGHLSSTKCFSFMV